MNSRATQGMHVRIRAAEDNSECVQYIQYVVKVTLNMQYFDVL